ncbi:MAG: hypothetical protein HY530_03305 [Chloroflexi bacterium]|nr:hypothetical protein [Chloroflexota bacterium]
MGGSRVRGGWAGKILRVDLTRGKIVEEPLTDDLAYDFIGSRGFDAKFLWEMVKPNIDPLSPENVLSLGAGLLTGTVFPECGRINVGCISALNGIYGFGNSGGWFPSRLKAAGYDHIVVTGKAPKPVYIFINDDGAQLLDAGDLWGKNTIQTEKLLRQKYGRDTRACCIGQAGENLVRTASTMVDGSFSAHGGSGAVWGSKNLKAIAATGTKKVVIADPDEFYRLAKREVERIKKAEEKPGYYFSKANYRQYGTLMLYDLLPNFVGYGADNRHLTPEQLDQIRASTLQEKYAVAYHAGCTNCLEHCTFLWEVFAGPYAGTRTTALRFGSTDYMTMGMGNADSGSMVKFHQLVNEYGMCGKMMPGAMAFALELYERGIITKEDTGGIELKAGDHETIIKLTHMTAFREGFGNMLAEGPYNMARKIPGAYPYRHGAYGRKYTPGLAFMTSPRGTDHLGTSFAVFLPPESKEAIYKHLVKKYPQLSSPTEPGVKGKGIWMVWEESNKAVLDSIGRCALPAGGIGGNESILTEVEDDPLAEGRARVLSALTGREWAAEQIYECGERITNVERAISVRQGASKEADGLPEADQHIEFDYLAVGEVTGKSMREYLEDYYRARGWDVNTGIPARAKLEELGLGHVADELEANAPYPRWQGPPL